MTDRKIILILFFFFVFFHLLFLGDYAKEAFYSSDEMFYFRLTQSLAERRSLEIEPYLDHTHSKYAPGQSIAGIPCYILGKLVLAFFPRLSNPDVLLLVFVHLTNVLIGALLCAVFYRFGRDLGYGQAASLGGALTLGLATTFLPFSKQYFADPLAALFLLLTVRYIFLCSKEGADKAFIAGLYFGAGILTKIDMGLLLIPLAIALIYEKKDFKKRMIYFAGGMTPFAFLILLYNHLNYGNAWSPGYERQAFVSPFFSGVFGLLFSPSRGLFNFSPSILLFFFGLKSFKQKFPGLFILCILLILGKIAILAKWFSWQGGWCWGPRLLLPIIPLLMLPALEIFEKWREQKGIVRASVFYLLVLGFGIQMIGTLVSPNKYNNDIWGMMGSGMNEFLFIPQLSTIKGNLFLLNQGKLDLGWIGFLKGGGAMATILFSLNIALALFPGGILLGFMGLKEKGWFSRFLPEAKALIAPGLTIVLILVLSHFIMKGQGFDRIRCTYLEESREPGTPAVSQTFKGYLHTPIQGEYQFSLKIRGTYEIELDRKVLLKNMGDLPQHWDFAKIHLAKGYHFMEIIYTPRQDSDFSLMHLYWTIPDGAEYKSIIGPMYLFLEPAGMYRNIVLGFVRYQGWIILITIIISFLKIMREDSKKDQS